MDMNESLPSLEGDYALPPDARNVFKEKGYVLLKEICRKSEIDAYAPWIRRVVQDTTTRKDTQGRIEEYDNMFLQVTNLWRMDEGIRRFVFARRFAKIAAELMGVNGVRLYHDQALFKPPGGKATPWHQDQFYWPLDTLNTITMWMPLVDAPRTMGTMSFAAGSHREGALIQRSISEETHKALDSIIARKGFLIEDFDVMAGDATFHSGWTVHSAHGNTSSSAREVMAIIYFADGARIIYPDNEFRKVDLEVFHPGLKPGDPANSPLNPLLFYR